MTDTDWMDDAKCRDYPPRMFFREDGSASEEAALTKRARRVCRSCPVRRECLRFALQSEQAGSVPLGMGTFIWNHGRKAGTWGMRVFTVSSTPPAGVWGGLVPGERHRKEIKHLELTDNVCSKGRACPGCRPLDSWVDLALEAIG